MVLQAGRGAGPHVFLTNPSRNDALTVSGCYSLTLRRDSELGEERWERR